MLDPVDCTILLALWNGPAGRRVLHLAGVDTQPPAEPEVWIGAQTLRGESYVEGVHRLLKSGYLDRAPGQQCRLSPAGERVAAELQRSNR